MKYVTLYLLKTNVIIGVTASLYCTIMNKNGIHFKSFFPEMCNCIVHVYYNLQFNVTLMYLFLEFKALPLS